MTILDFARRLEESGLEFYREMSAKSEHEGVRKVFDLLARDQQQLVDRLRQMQQRYAAQEKDDGGLLDRAINIFEKLRQREERLQVTSDLEAYQLALEAERKIVGQYREVLDKVGDPALKRSLLRVLALDKQELEELERLHDFVNAPTDALEWGEFSNLDEYHNFGRYTDLRQGELEDPVIPEPVKH